MRKLPDHTLKALRAVLRDGKFTDRDFILTPGIGRGTIAGLEARDWIVPIDPEGAYPRRYELTVAGAKEMERHLR